MGRWPLRTKEEVAQYLFGGMGQFGGMGMGCRGSRITLFLGAAPLLVTGCFLGPGGWLVGGGLACGSQSLCCGAV